jgi:hypothetical protein
MGDMTVKEQLHKIVDELPEDGTIEAMQYRLYVLQKVRQGLDAVDHGRGVEHGDVLKRMEKWLKRDGGGGDRRA